jgi:N-acetylneuraminic acid mutarotase
MKQILLFLLCAILSTSGVAQLKFEMLSEMKVARGAITSAADSNFIYMANGYSKTVPYTSEVEKYGIKTNTWTTLTKKSIPKKFASSALVGDKLYVFNGVMTGNRLNSKVEVIDVNTGAILLAVDNPNPVFGGGVAVWEGKIYTFGGAKSSKVFSNKLFQFDPVTNVWTELASMAVAKETKGAIVNGQLYIVGGYNGEQIQRVDRYDLQADNWAHVAAMPISISGNAVAQHEGKIYLVGDYSKLNQITMFDTKTSSFQLLQSYMTGRRHAASHVIGGNLYVLGGNQQVPITSSLASVEVAHVAQAE